MGRNKIPKIRFDDTKKQDIKYVFNYIKRKNVVKTNPLSTNQIYRCLDVTCIEG